MAVFAANPLVWRVGFAVAWLVGSWLFGPKQKKNDIFDPGAEEMPRWNTALRGVTLPVLFGTNRVSSQVTWQSDYTVVRNGGGDEGGGKFGGSGGGKGAAQTGNINYEYYWDLMYHLGMVPDRYSLLKGWLGSQRLTDASVAAIAGNSAGEFTFIDSEEDDRPEEEKATMTFADSFFYSGSGPALSGDSSATYDGWDEFATDMGVAARWPHTTYVGFKQLFLGSFPSVPQMSFEIGIGESSIDYDPSQYGKHSVSIFTAASNGDTPMVLGGNGNYYTITQVDTLADVYLSLVNKATGAYTLAATYTITQMRALATNYGISIQGCTLFYDHMVGVLAPYNYAILTFAGEAGAAKWKFFALLKVNSSGALEAVGGSSYQFSSNDNIAFHSAAVVGISNTKTLDDPIIVISESTVFGLYKATLHLCNSISSLLGANIVESNPAVGDLNVPIIDFANCKYFFTQQGRDSDTKSMGWLLPSVTGFDISGNPQYETRIYFWISKSKINSGYANPCVFIDNTAATYPDGFLCYIPLGLVSMGMFSSDITTVPTIDMTAFTELSGTAITFPFADNLLLADDTAANSNNYFPFKPQVSITKIQEGANTGRMIVVFSQALHYHASENGVINTAYSSFVRSKVFIWDPVNNNYLRLKDVEFQPFDAVIDFGVSSSTTFQVHAFRVFYDETDGKLYFLGDSTVGGTSYYNHFGEAGDFSIGGGGDVLPPYIIRQILTSDIFGIGLDNSQINETSYTESIDYCIANEFYISVQYRRDEPVLNIIDTLLSCYGGFLVISNGVVKFKTLGSESGVAAPARTIDNHHFVAERSGDPPVKVTKGARQDTFNKVRVNYFDRSLEYAQNQIEVADEVDQDFNGIRMREFPAVFVMQEKMARTMAERALWSNLYSRDTYEFTLGWKDADLEPGDIITIVDSFHSQLQGGTTARIIEWTEKERGKFQITAKQEFDYINSSSAAAINITSASIINVIGAAPHPRDFTMYELPYKFQATDGLVYTSWAANGFAFGANLWLSSDNVTFIKAKKKEPYQLWGTLLGGLPNTDGVVENFDVVFNPRSNWATTNSVYYEQTIPDADSNARGVGATLLWVGSEMLGYNGVTLVAQNRYRFSQVHRGMGGTNIHSHSSGDVFYKHGAGIFSEVINTSRIGQLLYYKVQPYNMSGVGISISSITAKQYRITGNHFLPQNIGAAQFLQNAGKTTVNVGSTIDIELNWKPTGIDTGYGMQTFGYGGYGAGSGDGNNYHITVIGSGGVSVRSEVVSVSSYSYTSSKNFTDNGAWRGNVAFEVRGSNQYGRSIRASVVSLNLW